MFEETTMELMLTLCLILLSLVVLYILVDISKPPAFPPGLSWLPFVGCYLQFRSLKSRLGYYHLVWCELARQYGPLVGLRLGKDRIVLVSGHHAVKHVLSRDDCDGRSDCFSFRLRTFNKSLGIGFVEGKIWQEHRHFVMRHLRQLGLGRDGMEKIILEECIALIDMLKQKCTSSEGTEVALHDLCTVSVTNTLWTVVAGQRYDLDDPQLQKLHKLNYMFFRNVDTSGGVLSHLPLLRYVAPEWTGYNALKKASDGMLSFLQKSVDEHKKTYDPEHTRDLIDTYIKEIYAQEEDPDSTFSEQQLLSVCLDLFMAGTETTNNQLAVFLLLMLHHTDIQCKIQAEIDRVVGRERLPNLADRPLLPYLNATIMEVQRFTSIVPTPVPHKTMEDCRILGYSIPKGTMLLMSLWSVHMNTNHWGDPHVFRPDRFLDATGENVIKDDWLMPFGCGKRRCLGEEMAKNNMYLLLAALLHNFSFDIVPGHEPPTLTPVDGITLSPQPFTGIITPR